MNRQIYQKYGFIIALIIAGAALPTSIISLTRTPNTTNNDYYNTYYNQTYVYNYTYYEANKTTVATVNTRPHSIFDWDSEAVAFDYLEGDKMIAVWSCFDKTIDVLFMNKENYQLFIDGLSFSTVLSAINTSYGFLEFVIIEPNLYFTVFYANYSNAFTYYQVSQYRFY